MKDRKLIISYVDAMREAAERINDFGADFVVSPMLGSVPFIDAMNIVSPNFDPSKVVYMPASSRVENIPEVIKEWYSGFLDEIIESPNNFPIVLGIDEVVSGASVIRCLKNINYSEVKKKRTLRQDLVSRVHSKDPKTAISAIDEADILTDNEYADTFGKIRERTKDKSYKGDRDLLKQDSKFFVNTVRDCLDEKLKYTTIGIEDSKGEGKRNFEYEEAKSEGRIIPVKIDSILTMDDPRYCPVRLEELKTYSNKKDYIRFSPRVSDSLITREYSEFLSSLAKIVGKDPANVHPVNIKAIFESSKYLS